MKFTPIGGEIESDLYDEGALNFSDNFSLACSHVYISQKKFSSSDSD